MGLVIVVVDAQLAGFDAVPDILGWLLVLLGVRDLKAHLPNAGTLLGLAGLAAVVSLALVRPDLLDGAPESTGWLLSLPQIVFGIVLSKSMAGKLARERPDVARRFGVLRWALLVTAIGPAFLYGAGVDLLLIPLAVLSVAANVYLIYLLFKVSGRTPAPLES